MADLYDEFGVDPGADLYDEFGVAPPERTQAEKEAEIEAYREAKTGGLLSDVMRGFHRLGQTFGATIGPPQELVDFLNQSDPRIPGGLGVRSGPEIVREQGAKLEALPQHPTMRHAVEAANKEEGLLGGLGAFTREAWDSPDTTGFLLSQAAELFPQIITFGGAAAAARPIANAIGGTLGSAAQLGSAGFLSSVANTYGPNVAEALEKGMEWDQAQARAQLQSVAQGGVDALTAAIIPWRIGPNQWVNIPAQTAIQMAGGAGGEALRSAVVGETAETGELAAEAMLEALGLPGEVVSHLLTRDNDVPQKGPGSPPGAPKPKAAPTPFEQANQAAADLQRRIDEANENRLRELQTTSIENIGRARSIDGAIKAASDAVRLSDPSRTLDVSLLGEAPSLRVQARTPLAPGVSLERPGTPYPTVGMNVGGTVPTAADRTFEQGPRRTLMEGVAGEGGVPAMPTGTETPGLYRPTAETSPVLAQSRAEREADERRQIEEDIAFRRQETPANTAMADALGGIRGRIQENRRLERRSERTLAEGVPGEGRPPYRAGTGRGLDYPSRLVRPERKQPTPEEQERARYEALRDKGDKTDAERAFVADYRRRLRQARVDERRKLEALPRTLDTGERSGSGIVIPGRPQAGPIETATDYRKREDRVAETTAPEAAPQAPTEELTRAPEERQQPEDRIEEYPRDAEIGIPAETGGSRVDAAETGEQPQAVGPRRGKVGDMLSPGEVVTTVSGRETTPFPKVPKKITPRAVKRIDAWLINNARAEAEARGDEYNALQFNQVDTNHASPADKDLAEEYLFGDVADHRPAVGERQEALPPTDEPQTKPEPKKETQRERYQRESKVSIEQDDILAAIAKSGGLSREEAEAQGIDPAEFGRRGWKIKRVFTKGGQSFDQMAETLSQYGYPVTDEAGRYSANAVLDAVDKALRGGDVRTPKGAEAQMEREAVEREAGMEEDPFGILYGEPGDVLDESEYSDDMDATDRRAYELAEQLDALEAGAGEAILERAAIAETPDEDVITQLENELEQRRQERSKEGPVPDEGTQGGGAETEVSVLETYTEEDLTRREQEAKAAEKREADEQAAAESKVRADRERSTFELTGSSRPADQFGGRQSDVFGTPIASEATPTATREGARNEPGELDQSGRAPLEAAPAEDVQGPAGGRTTEAGPTAGGPTDRTGNEPVDEGGRAEPRGGVGGDTGEVSSPEAEDPGTGASEPVPQPVEGRPGRTPERGSERGRSAGNYSIGDADQLGKGGAKTKFRQNVEAIRVLKQVQQESRPATKDEQAVLVKFVGWGGMPQAFPRPNGSVAKGWEDEVSELQELLTDDEYAAARRSTQDAHYTSVPVVNAIWNAMSRLGYSGGGRVLEPSMGTGNFLGLMPRSLRSNTRVTGVELDPITGGIAKLLYPKWDIHPSTGYQDLRVPADYFDVAVGNPPFGSQKVYDPNHKDISNFSIHNYFFAKSIDKLRPGGVLGMVVSHSLMDKASGKQRDYFASKARFLGAIRLPNTAFKENAGTEVVTDVIFLQKLAPGETDTGPSWANLDTIPDPAGGEPIRINEYFVKHPDMVLGTHSRAGSMYRADEVTVEPRPDEDLADSLAAAIERLPAGVYGKAEAQVEEIVSADVQFPEGTKVYGLFMADGKAYRRLPDAMGMGQSEPVEAAGKTLERIRDMVALRQAVRDMLRAEMREDSDKKLLARLRSDLNKAYDTFQKAHGYIHSEGSRRAFMDDPDYPLLLSLEKDYDRGVSKARARTLGVKPRNPSAKKADIFDKRVLNPVRTPSASTPKDALIVSLNETGRVDLTRMSELVGMGEDALTEALAGAIFQDPEAGWVTAEEYLSGNVKAKLIAARSAAETDDAFAKNVRALEKVQPEDVEAVDISVRPSSPWIPGRVIAEFITHLLKVPASAKYIPQLATWKVSMDAYAVDRVDDTATWGTRDYPAHKLIPRILNNRDIKVTRRDNEDNLYMDKEATAEANAKADEIRAEFEDWIWGDRHRRELLAGIYNDIYNTDRLRQYDGSHLSFPGKVPDEIIKLRPHQSNAVWRLVQDGRGLLDHVVGAGKTFTAIASAMEQRRMGLLRKPMFVVPNHLVEQWASDFYKLYPGAKVLAATKRDFEKKNRRALFGRIATGDWDAVIVAHSSFGFIPVPVEETGRFIQNQIDDMEAAITALKTSSDQQDKRTVKQMEKERDRLEEKLKAAMDERSKDDVVNFDELGVDGLYVDEAHEFKNLFFATKRQRVAGLGDTGGSQKSFDLFIKAQMIQQRNGGRGVYFLTGTPISNTLAEMFTMQRYLDYDNLKARNLAHFDAWADTFANAVTGWELDSTGVNYKLNTRFAQFVNLPELMTLYRSFADVVTLKDLKEQTAKRGKRWPVPKIRNGGPQNNVAERSNEQADYMEDIVKRAENMPDDPREDNMLKVTNDARKAGLDMRLIDPGATDEPFSKVNEAVRNILRIHDAWDTRRGTQLVFIDLSTPKGRKAKPADPAEPDALDMDELLAGSSGFSVYEDIRDKLIKAGVPEKEIRFIHDSKTDKQKAELFEEVRSGAVRVLLGSTKKMGAGMNVQNRLVALHHLDAPWRPADLEQREGRIIRQGNEFYEANPEKFEIEIIRYATKQTYDARMWQTLETKARFIEQVRAGSVGVREAEDITGEAASAAEMKAVSSGNPLILEQVELDSAVKKLSSLEKAYKRKIHGLQSDLAALEADGGPEARAERRIKAIEKDIETRNKNTGKTFHVAFDGQSFDKPGEAGKALTETVKSYLKKYLASGYSGRPDPVSFTYRGFPVGIYRRGDILSIKMKAEADEQTIVTNYGADSTFSGIGAITRLDNYMNGFADQIKDLKASAGRQAQQIQNIKDELKKPFKHEAELQDKRKRLSRVIELLQRKDGDEDAPVKALAARGEASTGSTVDQVKAELEQAYGPKMMGNLYKRGFSVVQSADEAEGSLPSDVQGVARGDGLSFLVADNLAPGEARGVLLHEIGAHFGLPWLLGERNYSRVKANLRNLRKTDKRVEAAYKRVPKETPKEDIEDEVLAYLVQHYPAQDISVLRRLISYLKRALISMGIKSPESLTAEDLTLMAQGALKQFARDAPVRPSPMGKTLASDADTTKNLMARRTPMGAAAQGVINDPRSVMEVVRESVGNKVADSRPAWLGALTRQQVVDVGKDVLPWAKKFERQAQRMDADRTDHQQQAAELANRWLKLVRRNRDEGETLADVMHEATLEGVDPDKGRAPAALQAKWDALSNEAKGIYREVRDAYQKRSREMQRALINRVNRSGASDEQKDRMTDTIVEHFQSARVRGPYFPLARFGDYWVRATKKGQEPEFVMTETQAEQRDELKRLRQMGYAVEFGKGMRNLKADQGPAPSWVRNMSEVVDSLAKGQQAELIKDGLYQLYLESLPELSVRKHFIHRKGRKGFSRDALRAFGHQMFHGSHQLARLNHGDILTRDIEQMREAAKTASDPNKAADIVKELDKRFDWAMNPTGARWANNLTSIGFLWYLGITPAAAAVNLTQVPIVAAPVIGAKHGFTKAMTALGKAGKDYVATRWDKKAKARLYAEYGGALGRAIEQAEQDGVLDKTLAHSLAGVSETEASIYQPVRQRAMEIISKLFHEAEKANRKATFIAAYRLSRGSGQGHRDAVEYATGAVWESQFDYSSANRARFMQSNTAKILLQFRQYSQNITYLLWRNAYQSVKGESPEVKAEALKKLIGVLGMTGVFAGAAGMPLHSVMIGMADLMHDLFGDDDEPWDAELAWREFLADMFGKEAGAVIAKGPINAALGVDISGRTTLDNLWVRSPNRELEGKDLAYHWLEQAAGPVIGIGIKAANGVDLMADGHVWRGTETMMPKAIKDVLKAWRYGTEGAKTLRGDQLADMSLTDAIIQAAGFTPADLAERYDENSALKRLEAKISDRRKRLIAGFAAALDAGDTDTRGKVLEKITAFNRANPEVAITRDTLRRSLRMRRRHSLESENGMMYNRRLKRRILEHRFLEDE